MSDYGLDADQFRRYVVRPALQRIELWSQSAENLVLGTALHESHLRYVDQLDKASKPGPAFGLFQMEGATHADHHNSYLRYQRELQRAVIRTASYFSADIPDPGEMVWNMLYAAVMCRVHYRRVKAALPPANDAHALAAYWKSFYNTHQGKGTVAQALPHFQKAIEVNP